MYLYINNIFVYTSFHSASILIFCLLPVYYVTQGMIKSISIWQNIFKTQLFFSTFSSCSLGCLISISLLFMFFSCAVLEEKEVVVCALTDILLENLNFLFKNFNFFVGTKCLTITYWNFILKVRGWC